jgi:uncharacterized protein
VPTELIPRLIAARAADFLAGFRVVIINGPRQSGKTAQLKQLNQDFPGSYLSLDEGALRAAGCSSAGDRAGRRDGAGAGG